MHGGSRNRAFFVDHEYGQLDFANGRWFDLGDYGLERQNWGKIAYPLLLQEGLVLPNPGKLGFSLFVPGLERTVWTSVLGHIPESTGTPVQMDMSLFSCLQDGDSIYLAQISIDTGEPSFLEFRQGHLSASQTPAVYRDTRGEGVIAWPAQNAVLLLRFSRNAIVPDGPPGKRLIETKCTDLVAGDYFQGVLIGDTELIAVSKKGVVAILPWKKNHQTLRLHDLETKFILKGEWECGPPMAVPSIGIAFLAANLEQGGALHLVVIDNSWKRHVIELRDNNGRQEHVAPDAPIMTNHLLFNGATVIIPSSTYNGCYRLITLGPGQAPQIGWISAQDRISALGHASCAAFTCFVDRTRLFAIQKMYRTEELERPVDFHLRHENSVYDALGPPVLGPQGLFLLCNGRLLMIPTT